MFQYQNLDGTSNEFLLLLACAAFISGLISGISGTGGGTILVAMMSTVFDPSRLIPIHGAIQIFSNLTRVVLNRKYIRVDIFAEYAVGAIFAALIGRFLVVEVPDRILALSIGVAVLLAIWWPERFRFGFIVKRYLALGCISTFLSLFIGVTGPILHPFMLRDKRLVRFGFIGTEACCSGFTHLLKVLVFFSLGFDYRSAASVILIMGFSTIAGSTLGKIILNKVSENLFSLSVKIVVTLLGIRMIFYAVFE